MRIILTIIFSLMAATAFAGSLTSSVTPGRQYYQWPTASGLKDSNRILVYDNLSGSRNITGEKLKSSLFNQPVITAPTLAAPVVTGSLNLDRVEPAVPPGLQAGTSGVLSGTFYYTVSYVTASGETEIPGLYASITVSGSRIIVTLPVSPDGRVIGRRIYRTPANPAENVLQYLVADIPDNTTVTYVDNIPDGSLGTAAPRINTTGGSITIPALGRVLSASGISTALGINALPGNQGYSNTAVGVNSLYSNVVGYRNTAYGVYSLYSNIDGARNTGGGVHSLNNNVNGNNNTAWGYAAMFNNTADNSTAIGAYALEQATSGGNNTAVGFRAMHDTVESSNNTGVGVSAGQANQTGNLNSYYGSNAGAAMQSGSFNTISGALAMPQATYSQSNTVYGSEALYSAINTASNVAIGAFAGYYETGSNKLYIDNQTRANEADGRVKALIYGVFDADPANQTLALNAIVNIGGKTPANASAACTAGTITWDTGYLYVCTATDTWKRAALTW